MNVLKVKDFMNCGQYKYLSISLVNKHASGTKPLKAKYLLSLSQTPFTELTFSILR